MAVTMPVSATGDENKLVDCARVEGEDTNVDEILGTP